MFSGANTNIYDYSETRKGRFFRPGSRSDHKAKKKNTLSDVGEFKVNINFVP